MHIQTATRRALTLTPEANRAAALQAVQVSIDNLSVAALHARAGDDPELARAIDQMRERALRGPQTP